MSLRVVAFVAVLTWAAPAGAQTVKVEFNAGTVSVSAQNAPLRTILAEWARLGGATIVNGDRLAGPPVTLELTNVTERQALDTLLRNAAGYMLAPRRAGTSGVSAFDRILILPTSVGPRNSPAPAAATPGLAGPRPLTLPRPPVAVQPDAPVEEPAVEPAQETPDPEPVATPTRPTPFGAPRPLVPPPARPTPPGEAAADDAPADETPAGAQPTATNPFGLPAGSSALPGVVTPARPTPAPQGR
jgi:hypothetical protein